MKDTVLDQSSSPSCFVNGETEAHYRTGEGSEVIHSHNNLVLLLPVPGPLPPQRSLGPHGGGKYLSPGSRLLLDLPIGCWSAVIRGYVMCEGQGSAGRLLPSCVTWTNDFVSLCLSFLD